MVFGCDDVLNDDPRNAILGWNFKRIISVNILKEYKF